MPMHGKNMMHNGTTSTSKRDCFSVHTQGFARDLKFENPLKYVIYGIYFTGYVPKLVVMPA